LEAVLLHSLEACSKNFVPLTKDGKKERMKERQQRKDKKMTQLVVITDSVII